MSAPAPAALRAACPHCAAMFELTAAQMEAREGLVRCGACRQIFNAKWHLVARRSEAAGADAADPQTVQARARRRWFAPGLAATALKSPARDAIAAVDLEAPPARAAPPRRRRGVDHYLTPRAHPLAGLLWALAALALVALLGAQVKYLMVERYAQHESLRPYLAWFCELAACRLPARHDPRRITLTRTHIDLHPRRPGALRVTVKLVNEATYSQPYPRLRLTLTDRDGWVVGRRTFAPAEYLSGRRNRLRSGELGAVYLDLAHPHEKAVGFEVDVVNGNGANGANGA